MRFSILGAVLLFAIIGTNYAWRDALEDAFNSNDLDLDWLYFGGDIIPGKTNVVKIDTPKLSNFIC